MSTRSAAAIADDIMTASRTCDGTSNFRRLLDAASQALEREDPTAEQRSQDVAIAAMLWDEADAITVTDATRAIAREAALKVKELAAA